MDRGTPGRLHIRQGLRPEPPDRHFGARGGRYSNSQYALFVFVLSTFRIDPKILCFILVVISHEYFDPVQTIH